MTESARPIQFEPQPDESAARRSLPSPTTVTDLATIPTPTTAAEAPAVGSDTRPDTPSADQKPTTPRTIAMMNQKGGVGKTTTCVNLGAALARGGHRVLLIDLDPQAHLSLHLGLEPDQLQGSMYDLMTDPDTTPGHIVQEVGENLALLPAEMNLAGVEAELADKVVTGAAQTLLRVKLNTRAGQNSTVKGQRSETESTIPAAETDFRLSTFDFVFIDCPPSLGLLTINALALAREVVVPMQAHFLALQGLSKLFETVNMVRQGINPDLMVSGIVLCMHESQTILAGEILADLSSFLDEARDTDLPWRDAVLLTPPIRRNIKLAESPSFGRSIFDYAPNCHGAEDYAYLAHAVAKQRAPTVR